MKPQKRRYTWRNRRAESPVQKYTCTNCGMIFEYTYRPQLNRVNHFCCNACKTEYYYFWNEMSERQLNILQRLIDNNGRDILPQGVSIDSMVFKICPLLEPLGCRDGNRIEVRITERGLYWHSLKRKQFEYS